MYKKKSCKENEHKLSNHQKLKVVLLASAIALTAPYAMAKKHASASGKYRDVHNEMADKYGHRRLPSSRQQEQGLAEEAEFFHNLSRQLREDREANDEALNTVGNLAVDLVNAVAQDIVDHAPKGRLRRFGACIKSKCVSCLRGIFK